MTLIPEIYELHIKDDVQIAEIDMKVLLYFLLTFSYPCIKPKSFVGPNISQSELLPIGTTFQSS